MKLRFIKDANTEYIKMTMGVVLNPILIFFSRKGIALNLNQRLVVNCHLYEMADIGREQGRGRSELYSDQPVYSNHFPPEQFN